VVSRRQTNIFSISGQIEEVAAQMMIKRYGCLQIMPWDFPSEVSKFDGAGRPVKFAIQMDEAAERQFDRLVEKLRA
jgi:hypothetical protein